MADDKGIGSAIRAESEVLSAPGPTPATAQRGAVIGAIFLMASSAIGPCFITQTTKLTAKMGAAFAFAILVSVLVEIALQLNVRRMITCSGRRAGELANSAIPFPGHFISVLVLIGGLAFHLGNIAGGQPGLNAPIGIDTRFGGLVTGALAIGTFVFKTAGPIVDAIVPILGVGMTAVTVLVAVVG